ncbi:PilT protein domain protein [Desulforamulus reducens MI-1]|uniref:PilT protein domain protein n=1 Tax=Desulforamulus reducens (strain ATCC BAA-1160 / DSM 100696 / MI-1) TaxID=349161 RepID=A4J783_DESRM|nr:type II toxin-antitoxin system VapC family toxin [Desulforamulus reducens]ABO50936.1 PilT protein domain protein [Desulforamulus reducens MI-1]
MESYVFDTYAVLGYFLDEPSAETIAGILELAKNNQIRLYMSWINVGEVYYIIQRRYDRKIAIELVENIKAWPIELIKVSHEQVIVAGDIKAKYPMSLGDSYVAALTIQVRGVLLTADKEFQQLENRIIKIKWLRKHR